MRAKETDEIQRNKKGKGDICTTDKIKFKKKNPACSGLYINGGKIKERRHVIEISLLKSWGDLLNFLLSLMFPKTLRLEFKEQENEVNDEIVLRDTNNA